MYFWERGRTTMEIFNNTTKIVKEDLEKVIKPNSKVSIAAAYFSIYAYQELKKQLSSVESLQFIFTSPTFVPEKSSKEMREFYIPRLSRERSLYGTEFEVKLRNELSQKVIAKECAEWIKKKVTFKSNATHESLGGFLNVQNSNENFTYMPLNGFTTVDIGCERGNNLHNMVNKFDSPFSDEYIKIFNSLWNDTNKLQDVTDELIEHITAVYQENPPELIYFMTLYNIFSEFLDDISEDDLPNEATGFKESVIWNKLYNFQKDAVLAIINKLEKYNGCILADSVGLGKTFSALAVVKYYENRNKNVLVLCPKKLKDNWMTYRGNLINNPLAKDRLRYDVLFHTDLSRDKGDSAAGLPLDRINWGNYDLVVIDESHNFRNGGSASEEDQKENRYQKLLNKIIRSGVKTKVLMLSATPVNNRFYDLRNQLALAYEGNSGQLDEKLNTKSDIDTIFRQAQRVFNDWSKRPAEQRTTDDLLKALDFDFFEVLDSVTIARSRKHIQRYYDTTEIGNFPKRNKPISLYPKLTNLDNAINYHQIFEQLMTLTLAIYTPTKYIHKSKLAKYIDIDSASGEKFTTGREMGIKRLMNINLLKRMESSVHSFKLTVYRIQSLIQSTLTTIHEHKPGSEFNLNDVSNIDEFDLDDQNVDVLNIGKKLRIDMQDMDYLSWERDLAADLAVIDLLLLMIEDITPKYDYKLNQLFEVISNKIQNPINPNNHKIIIFTAFADTAEYLFENVSTFAKQKFGLESALVTGTINGRTTIPRFHNDMNNILTCFSPVSKDKALVMPKDQHNFDILIATDCISEGQNLQDCDFLINYDIHWNPVRIIQRFGRIDRIGSKNKVIQLVNFWPDLSLDEYINLKGRVETKMRISVMTATGDDDYINQDENGDLTYRRQQLERLQNEVVDIEDMTSGISIMDLGLNEFRMDLLAYMKENPSMDKLPYGIHAVVKGEKPGVIFVLKNINKSMNLKTQNRIHPFYLVYIGEDGQIVSNHLEPKNILDLIRYLAKGKSAPDMDVSNEFNRQTKDGKQMDEISALLQQSISSMIAAKEQSDIDSFFGLGTTTFLADSISGLNDFELVCFMVVLEK